MSKEYQKNEFNNSMMSNCQKVAFFFAGFPLVLKHGNGQSPSSLMIFLLKTNINPSGFASAMLHVCFPGGIHEIPMILIIFQPYFPVEVTIFDGEPTGRHPPVMFVGL